MVKVRRLTEADRDQVLRMGRALVDESPNFRGKGFEEAKASAIISHAAKGQGCVGFVAVEGDEIIGMVIMLVVEQLFSYHKYATDIVLYVKPERRLGRAALLLMREVERWAKEENIPEVTFGVGTGIHLDKTVHMYEKLGYKVTGTSLTKVM